MQYDVLNLAHQSGDMVQGGIKKFLEQNSDIVIRHMNVWSNCGVTYATVVFTRQDFNL